MRATRTRASRAIGAAQLGGPRPWAIVPGLAIIAVLAGLDAAWDERRIIASTVVVGPFVTAIFGTARQTVVVAVAAIATILLSGFWNDNLGTVDYFVRLVVVAAGAAFAVIGASSRMRLQADRVRFRLLRAVAAIGDGAPTVEATGARVCELLVPSVADVCVVDVVRRGGAQRVAVRAAGPRAAEIEDGLRRRRIGAGAPALGAAAVRSGEALLIAGPDEELLQAVAGDPEDLAFLRSLGGRAGIVVPLGARGRSIGTLALVATDASGRTFDADDAEFARLLAGRVALTL